MTTAARQTHKAYKCARCGHVQTIQTNHYLQCYSHGHCNTCPKCPPFAKYPEFGGGTVWNCLETAPAVTGQPYNPSA